jgi:hemolysin III
MMISSEEKANTLIHLIPFAATLALAWPLLRLASEHTSEYPYALLGTVLFLVGMTLMFGSSTLYHAVSSPELKRRLRIVDHIAIYVMIAGSYSVICLSALGGWIGWALFTFLWICVIAGAIGKLVAFGKHPNLSLVLYLAMGWAALLVLGPMWKSMSHLAFAWIVAEGVFYTIGAYFFHNDEKHAYWHAIWHVFIVLGATSHTVATWIIVS